MWVKEQIRSSMRLILDTQRDRFNVKKILGDNLKKANKSRGKKKKEELGEEPCEVGIEAAEDSEDQPQ